MCSASCGQITSKRRACRCIIAPRGNSFANSNRLERLWLPREPPKLQAVPGVGRASRCGSICPCSPEGNVIGTTREKDLNCRSSKVYFSASVPSQTTRGACHIKNVLKKKHTQTNTHISVQACKNRQICIWRVEPHNSVTCNSQISVSLEVPDLL